MGNEFRFNVEADIFPPADRPALAQAISDQGCAQIGRKAVNTLLARDGKITVIVEPGNRWLQAEGFRVAVQHWFDNH